MTHILASFAGTALYIAGICCLIWWACTRDAPGTEGDGLGAQDQGKYGNHGERN